MLSDELRTKLMELMKSNPQEAVKEVQKEPKFLEILLNNENELKNTKEQLTNERTKYVNMTAAMQTNLKEQAEKLKTTQGLLLGAGLLLFLRLLSEEE